MPYLSVGPRIQAREYVGLSCHGTGGRDIPAAIYDIAYNSESGFSAGFDHPIIEELLGKMFTTTDLEGHWKIMNDMARFMYENALDSGFYSVNVLWPLGPRVDSWREHLQMGGHQVSGFLRVRQAPGTVGESPQAPQSNDQREGLRIAEALSLSPQDTPILRSGGWRPCGWRPCLMKSAMCSPIFFRQGS